MHGKRHLNLLHSKIQTAAVGPNIHRYIYEVDFFLAGVGIPLFIFECMSRWVPKPFDVYWIFNMPQTTFTYARYIFCVEKKKWL